MHRNATRRLVRTLAGAALPVLLVAGCSSSGSDSEGSSGGDGGASASPSGSASPSPPAVKFRTLPDPCTTVSGGTIDKVVPKADSKKGKNLGSDDAKSQGTCLWSGVRIEEDDYQFRSLSVSLKRYDSHASLGSGDERATAYLTQQAADIAHEKSNEKVTERDLQGLGQQAKTVSYQSEKKDSKGKGTDYREERIVVRTANVVVTVDYQGAGFEGSDTPSAKAIHDNALRAAKEAVAAIK